MYNKHELKGGSHPPIYTTGVTREGGKNSPLTIFLY